MAEVYGRHGMPHGRDGFPSRAQGAPEFKYRQGRLGVPGSGAALLRLAPFLVSGILSKRHDSDFLRWEVCQRHPADVFLSYVRHSPWPVASNPTQGPLAADPSGP